MSIPLTRCDRALTDRRDCGCKFHRPQLIFQHHLPFFLCLFGLGVLHYRHGRLLILGCFLKNCFIILNQHWPMPVFIVHSALHLNLLIRGEVSILDSNTRHIYILYQVSMVSWITVQAPDVICFYKISPMSELLLQR